jgi:hypothetical protein
MDHREAMRGSQWIGYSLSGRGIWRLPAKTGMQETEMTATELRRRAKRRIERLSPVRLAVADDFLAYLEERDVDEATEELLRIPGFADAFEQARSDISRGAVTPVEELQRRT